MKRILVASILCVALLGSAAFSFAWFFSAGAQFPDCSATLTAAYFAGGNGTKDSPYEINAPIHLYNLTWLQHKGAFDGETHYFKLTSDVDMGAETSPVTGAIPPIGSTDHPFQGYFDGQGYTISNLWVSSDPDDWRQKPDSYDPTKIGRDIGMFGYVEKSTDDVTYVGNFYLEKVEVTTDVTATDGSVGIIAGKVNASVSEIGVIGAKITAKSGAVPVSDYSLIGKTDAEVIWTDAPGSSGSGGSLSIQPNNTDADSPYRITDAFTSGNAGATLQNDKQAVPGASADTAYFLDSTTSNSIKISSGSLNGCWLYNTTISYPAYVADGSFTQNSSTTANRTTILEGSTSGWTKNPTSVDASNQEKADFYAYYRKWARSAKHIKFGQALTIYDGMNPDNLQNCVWFTPRAAGKCVLAFAHQSNNTTDYMSLFRYKRGGTESAPEITQLQELRFQLTKSHGNKSVNYYEIALSEDDLQYEYVIGRGYGDVGNAAFFYMMLAGSDEYSGTAPSGTGKVLEKIDFLSASPSSFDTIHLPVLAINDGTTTAVSGTLQTFYYAVFADELVHYYTDGNVPVSETTLSSLGADGTRETSADGFPAISNNPVP